VAAARGVRKPIGNPASGSTITVDAPTRTGFNAAATERRKT
jgi:hypothetical protein